MPYKIRWTEEQELEIINLLNSNSVKDTAQIISDRLNKTVTTSQIRGVIRRRIGALNTPDSDRIIRSKVYPKDFYEYMTQVVPGHSRKEITEIVNEHFKTEYTEKQIAAYMKNHKLRNGLDGRIPPGGDWRGKLVKNYPPNSGQYKTGHAPHNQDDVGTRKFIGGYWWTKLRSDPKVRKQENWKQDHIIIYEKHYGKIPDGMKIIFLDGDHDNLDINNLKAVTNGELATMNNCGLKFNDAELTEVGLSIAKLKIKTRKKNEQYSKDKKNKRQDRGGSF